MQAFKIDWKATANHPNHEWVLSQVEKDTPYYLSSNGKYITIHRTESDEFEDAIFFANRRDAQSWGQGLAGQWSVLSLESSHIRPGRPLSGDQPKEQVTTRIDAELKQKAKDAGLNLAEILEEGIRRRINS